MSLPHALLTALVERSCSGSELAARFDRSIGHFWHATHQQIYRELSRLEAAGLIESLPEEATRGRRRAYRILPFGRDELRQWITREEPPPALRDELMLRLRAEAAVGPTDLVPEIRRRITLHQAKLALYQDIEARDFPTAALDRETALQQLVLDVGIEYERNWINVLQRALQALALPPRGADAPHAGT